MSAATFSAECGRTTVPMPPMEISSCRNAVDTARSSATKRNHSSRVLVGARSGSISESCSIELVEPEYNEAEEDPGFFEARRGGKGKVDIMTLSK
jgi:hypothetical protein